MGDNATAQSFQQIWAGFDSSINLADTSRELVALESALKAEADNADQEASVTAVQEAAKAAAAGDGPSMLRYLSKAGKWAFSVAERIGVTLAAAVIKSAVGI
ncbi:MAG: hypothetical protein P0Y59_13850 [Candidatus Sphingomonas phytovorans]|nr:hypothetical protein [Sphingomonas sp.]WEJ98041.1 MAG: hypothetical protein P0Y59_13850 [Sphingomonas sp.]